MLNSTTPFNNVKGFAIAQWLSSLLVTRIKQMPLIMVSTRFEELTTWLFFFFGLSLLLLVVVFFFSQQQQQQHFISHSHYVVCKKRIK